jgi:hypothetical protein
MVPLPTIGEEYTSAIRTFSLPNHGAYNEKLFNDPFI